jgi:stalled ribosome alternative rescue factor ArfA
MSDTGIEDDPEIRAALDWFAEVSEDPSAFWFRVEQAQDSYRRAVALEDNLGRDLPLEDLGSDKVGSYLAQAYALLNDRRAYDLVLGSRVVPFIKHLGGGIEALRRMPGAAQRVSRFLRQKGVDPESAIFELAVAVTYAHQGFATEFISEAPGTDRRPDLVVRRDTLVAEVECKRLGKGDYERVESAHQRLIFEKLSGLIHERRLSFYMDVNYTQELKDVPVDYLDGWVRKALDCRIMLPSGFPWKDEFGRGMIRRANLEAVHHDTAASSLIFGPKMARLLTGAPVAERAYNMAGSGKQDLRDVRFVEQLYYGTVVTWQCVADNSINSRARYIRSKLAEIDKQLKSSHSGIAHIGMEAERDTNASDLRRERNKEVIQQFQFESRMTAAYLHYFVPRVTEVSAWMIDETPDRFGPGSLNTLADGRIFSRSDLFDNDLAAWHQKPPPPLHSE